MRKNAEWKSASQAVVIVLDLVAERKHCYQAELAALETLLALDVEPQKLHRPAEKKCCRHDSETTSSLSVLLPTKAVASTRCAVVYLNHLRVRMANQTILTG